MNYRFLAYEDDAWFFEVINMAFKVFFGAFIIFCNPGSPTQLFITSIALLLYFLISADVHPYILWEDDLLWNISLLCLVASIILAQVNYYSNAIEWIFSNQDNLNLVLFIFTAVPFIACLVLLIKQVFFGKGKVGSDTSNHHEQQQQQMGVENEILKEQVRKFRREIDDYEKENDDLRKQLKLKKNK